MDKKDGQKVVSYPADTKEFVISYGSYVTGIEGVEKLPFLETIELTGTAFLSDYSFLESCKNLRYLMLWAIDIEDLSFLKDLQNLEVLSIEECHISTVPNLSHMKKHRYLSLKSCFFDILEGAWKVA